MNTSNVWSQMWTEMLMVCKSYRNCSKICSSMHEHNCHWFSMQRRRRSVEKYILYLPYSQNRMLKISFPFWPAKCISTESDSLIDRIRVERERGVERQRANWPLIAFNRALAASPLRWLSHILKAAKAQLNAKLCQLLMNPFAAPLYHFLARSIQNGVTAGVQSAQCNAHWHYPMYLPHFSNPFHSLSVQQSPPTTAHQQFSEICCTPEKKLNVSRLAKLFRTCFVLNQKGRKIVNRKVVSYDTAKCGYSSLQLRNIS